MSYAILRIGKLKTFGRINAAGNHNLRLKNCSNANPEKKHLNISLVDKGPDLAKAVKARLSACGIKKWRKDAVLATEILLTASPEFFEKGASEEAWIAENRRWLMETFGDNIVSAVVHRDETTPHIHCILVPIKDQRLSHKNLFGGARNSFVQWQTDYARRMSCFGLERGVEGSTAKHEKIRKFYATVNAKTEEILDVMPARPDLTSATQIVGVFKKESVIPVSKALGLFRSYRATVKTYIVSIVNPLQAQIHRLKRQLDEKEKALRASRQQTQRAEILVAKFQRELSQSQRTEDRFRSFIKIAEAIFPNLVTKVREERERLNVTDMLHDKLRSVGVKGALAPLGTHSTLLKQRVGSFGQKGKIKSAQLKPF